MNIELTSLIIVCMAAFAAGFIDAIVGGGGLVQTPVMLITFPHMPVASLLGTVKVPSFCGTGVSAWQYAKRVSINKRLVIWVAASAFMAAMCGSAMVSLLNNQTIKPIILVILIIVAIYSYTKKDMGQFHVHDIPFSTALWRGISAGLVIGFYDGFVGPGTGSFLVLAFISLLGNDMLHASAHAKLVNLATNMSSIIFFSFTGHIILQLALPMAVFNMLGGAIGTRLALLKGNRFIRIFFLIVVCGTILRFGYDIFFK